MLHSGLDKASLLSGFSANLNRAIHGAAASGPSAGQNVPGNDKETKSIFDMILEREKQINQLN